MKYIFGKIMKTLLPAIIVSILFITQIFAQEMGYINDSDGYSNLRSEPSGKSNIIGIITKGQEFYYYPDNSADWWRVEFLFQKGYMHKSRITNFKKVQSKVDQFYQEFYTTDRNNAEMGEVNNENLFLWFQDYPLACIKAFCSQKQEIQDFLLSELESPIHDMIDLQLIYSRLLSIDTTCAEQHKILKTIEIDARNINIELKKQKIYTKSIPDFNKPNKEFLITNQWFTSEINGKSILFYLEHPDIDTYSKMFYQGQFDVSDDSLTFAMLDSVLTKNTETRDFYLYIFNCVLRITDGALSEMMGKYCRAYLKNYPCDFIALKSSPIYKDNYNAWIDFAGYEYYYAMDPIKEINKNIDELKTIVRENCKNQTDELENIRKKLIEFINEINN